MMVSVPSNIFKPSHSLSLLAYVEVTIVLHTSPNVKATPLILGKTSAQRCNKLCYVATVQWLSCREWFLLID